MIQSSNGLILSPKTRLKLSDQEEAELREYVENDRGAFVTIKVNTKISPDTIKLGLERGWFQADTVLKLQDFLKKLKGVKI